MYFITLKSLYFSLNHFFYIIHNSKLLLIQNFDYFSISQIKLYFKKHESNLE